MATWVVEGLTALISGMTAVFMILVLISVVIGFFKYLNPIRKEKEITEMDLVVEEPVQPIEEKSDPEEIHRVVAAITAVLSNELNVSADSLRVKRLKRL